MKKWLLHKQESTKLKQVEKRLEQNRDWPTDLVEDFLAWERSIKKTKKQYWEADPPGYNEWKSGLSYIQYIRRQ